MALHTPSVRLPVPVLQRTRLQHRHRLCYTGELSDSRLRPHQTGDTALLKSNEALPYVAEIQGIQFDKKGLLHVQCGWYFRPEDLDGGRQSWQGQQELFRSTLTGTSSPAV